MIIKISLDIKKSVEICDNLWTKKTSVEKIICGNLWTKKVGGREMLKANGGNVKCLVDDEKS